MCTYHCQDNVTGTVLTKKVAGGTEILNRTLTCFKPLKLIDERKVRICSDNEIIVMLLCFYKSILSSVIRENENMKTMLTDSSRNLGVSPLCCVSLVVQFVRTVSKQYLFFCIFYINK